MPLLSSLVTPDKFSGIVSSSTLRPVTNYMQLLRDGMPEVIESVFVKTSPKCSFLVIENARFGLVLGLGL
jgi:hypothetical protein